MMKRKLIGSIDLKNELKSPEPVIVEYFCTVAEEWEEGYDSQKPFGIEVVKNETLNGVTYREVKTVERISSTQEQAEELLGILHRNSVTPVCVADVLEDIYIKK